MPVSLSKSSQKDGDYVTKKSDAPPEVQMVREDGVVKAVPVDGIHRLGGRESNFEEDLLEGLTDSDVVNNSEKTGFGEQLAREGQINLGGLDQHKRSDVQATQNVYAVINQAVDAIVDEHPECYEPGWERDTEFVEATVELIISEYDFERSDVIKAIKTR